MTAILIFGGRQWNSNSLFSYERDHLSSKNVKKSWSNLGLRKQNKFEQVFKIFRNKKILKMIITISSNFFF